MTRLEVKNVRNGDSVRKPYASPRLAHYGKLTELTNGGNQSDRDAFAASGAAGFAEP